MTETMKFGARGVVYFSRGKELTVNGNKYVLDSQLAFNYIDWQGAYAGIYFSNPLRPNETIRFPPNLEEGDAWTAANSLLEDLAAKYDKLKRKDPKDLIIEEKLDLQILNEMLRAA